MMEISLLVLAQISHIMSVRWLMPVMKYQSDWVYVDVVMETVESSGSW